LNGVHVFIATSIYHNCSTFLLKQPPHPQKMTANFTSAFYVILKVGFPQSEQAQLSLS